MTYIMLALLVLIFIMVLALCVVSPKIFGLLKAVPTKDDLTAATAAPEDEEAKQAAEKLEKLKTAATALGITITDDMTAADIQTAISSAVST